MIVYGQSIAWTPKKGERLEVSVHGRSSPEEAMQDAMHDAEAFGFTPPKWWQWWRWNDTEVRKWWIHQGVPYEY